MTSDLISGIQKIIQATDLHDLDLSSLEEIILQNPQVRKNAAFVSGVREALVRLNCQHKIVNAISLMPELWSKELVDVCLSAENVDVYRLPQLAKNSPKFEHDRILSNILQSNKPMAIYNFVREIPEPRYVNAANQWMKQAVYAVPDLAVPAAIQFITHVNGADVKELIPLVLNHARPCDLYLLANNGPKANFIPNASDLFNLALLKGMSIGSPLYARFDAIVVTNTHSDPLKSSEYVDRGPSLH